MILGVLPRGHRSAGWGAAGRRWVACHGCWLWSHGQARDPGRSQAWASKATRTLYKDWIGMLKGTRTLGEIQFLSLFYFTGSASWNSREMPVQGVKWIVACRPDQCPGIWCAAMYLFHAQREHHDMPWAILQCTKMGDLMATKMDQSFHVISVCWWIALSLSCIVPIWWAVPCLELF